MPGGRLYQGVRSLTTAPDWIPATSPSHPASNQFYTAFLFLSMVDFVPLW
jgi:hypothetical protein